MAKDTGWTDCAGFADLGDGIDDEMESNAGRAGCGRLAARRRAGSVRGAGEPVLLDAGYAVADGRHAGRRGTDGGASGWRARGGGRADALGFPRTLAGQLRGL